MFDLSHQCESINSRRPARRSGRFRLGSLEVLGVYFVAFQELTFRELPDDPVRKISAAFAFKEGGQHFVDHLRRAIGVAKLNQPLGHRLTGAESRVWFACDLDHHRPRRR